MTDLEARVAEEQARPLPADGLAEVVAAIWPGGAATSVERLRGGLGAAMHRVEATTADGRPDAVVLRLFLAAYDDGPEVAAREHLTLARLAALGAPVPEPRWVDASGAVLGRPALAMEVVPGRPMVGDREPDVVALASALVAVHALTVRTLDHLPGPGTLAEQVTEALPMGRRVHDGFVDTDPLWAAIDRWIEATPPGGPALVHGDFHPGNVLTDGRSVTVVDWTWASVGDPGRDLAYCRYDLALAYGPEVAAAFTEAYVAAGGPATPSAGWDLVAVASSLPSPAGWLRAFLEQGRDDCTAAGFEAAGRTFLADALARLR